MTTFDHTPAFLYKELETLTKYVSLSSTVPEYITTNVSPQLAIRPYQEEAIRYTIHLLEHTDHFKDKPIHLLYHMATGSGKTYMMAALILYFYKKGYRNFLFFTNQNAIIDKTIQNLSNKNFSKYLFNQNLSIEGQRVEVKRIDSLKNTSSRGINLMFSTINQIHKDLTTLKEDGLTLKDFQRQPLILLSDESHHFNASTKKDGELNEETWEYTINKMLNAHEQNVLLEFTATCDLKNKHIVNKYCDKLIYNYPLLKFRADGYTKDFFSIQSTLEPMLMVLQTMLLSQYRLKLFEKHGIANSKPVILLNSRNTTENKEFYDAFNSFLKTTLAPHLIDDLKAEATGVFKKMFDFFEVNNLTSQLLVDELKFAFSPEHLLLLDSKQKDKEAKIQMVNDLENPANPIRMVFSVSMLNEGWDVLNLFDIVRLYQTKSNPKKISSSTISDAQLIGRGVRYFPFAINEDQDLFKRKYDENLDHELRICETFYYHCQQDSRYILELRNALKETGFGEESSEKETFNYVVKEEFLNSPIYKVGKLLKNKRIKKPRQSLESLNPYSKINTEYLAFNQNLETSLTDDSIQSEDVVLNYMEFKLSELYQSHYPTLSKAVRQFPAFNFNHLKSIFPTLTTLEEFLTDDKFAGNFKLTIVSKETAIDNLTLYKGLLVLLNKLSNFVTTIKPEFVGSTLFEEVALSDYVKNVKRFKNSTSLDGEGISQNDYSVDDSYRLDLSNKDWFVYTDHYGTTEEKRFVKFFNQKVSELKTIYEEVYLIRNERQFHIYSISEKHNGERFEPDFILLLRKSAGGHFEQQQIFIEPKGEHLVEVDRWKQEFLLELAEKADIVIYHDTMDYKIIGLPFYTHNNQNFSTFEQEFEKLLKTNTEKPN